MMQQQEERRALASPLLSSVDFRLFSQAGFDSLMEDIELLETFGLTESVTAAKSYRESRLDRRISELALQLELGEDVPEDACKSPLDTVDCGPACSLCKASGANTICDR